MFQTPIDPSMMKPSLKANPLTLLKRPGPKGGVRDTNRQQKMNALRDAALQLFLERGVESVSVDDITRLAKMAKGSFYRYFNDQPALVADLVEPVRSCLDAALATCAKLLDKPGASGDVLWREVEVALMALQHTIPRQVRLYLQECRSPGTGARRAIVDLAKHVSVEAIDLARVAKARGIINAANPALAALGMVGTIERLVLATLQGEDAVAPAEVLAALRRQAS
jgi:AcrR family transcriptional regulator